MKITVTGSGNKETGGVLFVLGFVRVPAQASRITITTIRTRIRMSALTYVVLNNSADRANKAKDNIRIKGVGSASECDLLKTKAMNKKILDATAGSRMMWFDKKNPEVVFADIRSEEIMQCDGRVLSVYPDTGFTMNILCSAKALRKTLPACWCAGEIQHQ